ncbi:MAG: hypothetical protein GXP45_02770 [bacterium]|nr:hypothetical protein [bacterium]
MLAILSGFVLYLESDKEFVVMLMVSLIVIALAIVVWSFFMVYMLMGKLLIQEVYTIKEDVKHNRHREFLEKIRTWKEKDNAIYLRLSFEGFRQIVIEKIRDFSVAFIWKEIAEEIFPAAEEFAEDPDLEKHPEWQTKIAEFRFAEQIFKNGLFPEI